MGIFLNYMFCWLTSRWIVVWFSGQFYCFYPWGAHALLLLTEKPPIDVEIFTLNSTKTATGLFVATDCFGNSSAGELLFSNIKEHVIFANIS